MTRNFLCIELALNDIGAVTLRTSTVVIADPYSDNRDNGAFILIDETTNDTVGAGTITEAREVKPGAATRNDIRWHPSSLDREYRWGRTGQRGATLWFTGLPASGKSTVAVAVERALVESGQVAYLLDGDNLRHGLNADLGFSMDDRAENLRRLAQEFPDIHWLLIGDDGKAVFVRNDSPAAAGLPLKRIRGQITRLTQTASSAECTGNRIPTNLTDRRRSYCVHFGSSSRIRRSCRPPLRAGSSPPAR